MPVRCECLECDGTGLEWPHKGQCPDCRGVGYVTDAELEQQKRVRLWTAKHLSRSVSVSEYRGMGG